MNGLVEEAELFNVTSRFWISAGLYVYPTIKFQCNGQIQGISGIAYFEALGSRNYYYNRNLLLNLQLWRQNQSYYAPTGINSSVVFSPEEIASGSDSSTAPVYFSNIILNYNFSINLGNASIDVMAGDILGISLPPNTSYVGNTQINRIPIRLADDFVISYSNGRSPCWSPTLGATLCNRIFSTYKPLLSLNFTSTSMPTGKLAT